MLVLFVLGFVLDFLGSSTSSCRSSRPVIYGGRKFRPEWVTIMIAVDLQTSFLTPPFGFLRCTICAGWPPPQVTTGHIFAGIIPFVLIQVVARGCCGVVPGCLTIVPDLLGG